MVATQALVNGVANFTSKVGWAKNGFGFFVSEQSQGPVGMLLIDSPFHGHAGVDHNAIVHRWLDRSSRACRISLHDEGNALPPLLARMRSVRASHCSMAFRRR